MFKIYLYHMSTENNRMDKTNYLTQIAELNGELREATSVINPSITFQIKNDMQDLENGVLDCNYIYIPNFKRYYFVDNIVCVTNTLWEIDCSVDVLMSFKDQLGELDVYCNRNEFKTARNLIDEKVPVLNEKRIDFYTFVIPDSISDYPFKQTFDNGISTDFCILMSTSSYNELLIGQTTSEHNATKATPPNTNYYAFTGIAANSFFSFLYDGSSIIWENFINGIKRMFNEPTEAIRFIRVYPLPWIADSVDDFINSVEDVSQIRCANSGFSLPIINGVQVTAQRYYSNRTKIIKGGYVHFYNYYNCFLDKDPFTVCEIYIPFVGYVELPTDIVMGRYIYITYSLDLESVSTLVLLHLDRYDGEIIYMTTCQICYEFPVIRSNQGDILRSVTGAVISLAAGAATGGVGLVAGAANAASQLTGNFVRYAESNKSPSQKAYFKAKRNDIQTSFKADTAKGVVNYISESSVTVINSLKQKWSIGNVSNDVIHQVSGSSSTNVPKARITRPVPFFNLWYRNESPSFPITYLKTNEYKKYCHLVGTPTVYNGKLSELKGYTELSGFHLEGIKNCTSTEQDAINDILRLGFLMPDP